MRLKIRRASLRDAPVLAAFNSAMALETEGKVLLPDVIGAGVRGLLRRPHSGFYIRRRGVCGFRLYVERHNRRAQATYRANGMERTHYLVYEQLKPGIRFFRPARERR